ncbi:MAG: DNA-binding response regulator [Candidatus Tectimicrobiota bacterium]|nr:MAG: DNA-binding response regulator [Candidatus Tectomicrobia bacterium]
MPADVPPQRFRILVVDDHPIVRRGLVWLLAREPDLEVCGEAEDAAQALAAVEALRPDLAIVDIALRASSGLDLIKTLHAQVPQLPVLVLSIHDETLYAERVLRAGGRGYVMKQEATETLLQAVRQVLRGELYLSPRMASRLLAAFVQGRPAPVVSPLQRLSDRELEVFRLLGQGYSTRQVAAALHVSVKTVETHRAHLMKKLHLASAAELLRYATQWVNHPERG